MNVYIANSMSYCTLLLSFLSNTKMMTQTTVTTISTAAKVAIKATMTLLSLQLLLAPSVETNLIFNINSTHVLYGRELLHAISN